MKILIIRLSSFGDVVLTTPVLKALKDKYNDIEIDFLVMDKFKSAIEGSKYIDNLIVFKRGIDDKLENLKKLGKELNDNNYDYVFDLHNKQRSIVISKMIDAKVYRYKKRAFWKSALVKMKLIKYKVDRTIVEGYFEPFDILDLKYTFEDLDFSFSENDLKNIKEEYRDKIVFAPGASKDTKKWIPEEFGKLAAMLYENTKEKIVIIGGEEDFERGEIINKVSKGVCINLCGKLSLKESGALLSKSKFLVTNDSGPFHIARGVKCKTFVIFGPTNPELFKLEERDTLIYLNEECSPCSLHGDKVCPKKHFNCMKKLEASMVYKIISEKLKGGK